MPPLPSDRIQAARLVDRLGHAEMHLGVRTASFGSVQVHTIVRDSQVGVTIGSERGDLKSYLTSEVAGLESNLRQHDLHFADVRFVGTNLSSGGNQYGEKDSRQQSSQQGHAYARPTTRFTVDPRSPMDNETTNQQITGLSIHV